MKPFPVVMLAGIKQSGKDTLAQRLLDEHGFVRLAFADYLKRVSADFLRNLGVVVEKDMFTDPVKKEQTLLDEDGKPFLFETTVKGVSEVTIDTKCTRTAREFLQYFGSDVCRNKVHTDIWVLPVVQLIKQLVASRNHPITGTKGAVITDMRFPNEYNVPAKILLDRGVTITTVHIHRPTLVKRDLHISETALDKFDFDKAITNDGTIDELWRKADALAEEIL